MDAVDTSWSCFPFYKTAQPHKHTRKSQETYRGLEDIITAFNYLKGYT